MSPSDRYTPTAIALHWIIALAVIAQFTWGWAMQAIPKQPPGLRADAFNMHKSIGLTILALMILRALWRWRHPPPPLPKMPAWQKTLARANHGVLYACLFLMPLAGYLGSVFSGYPVKYFGVTLPAWGFKDEGIKNAMSAAHFTVSWVLLKLVPRRKCFSTRRVRSASNIRSTIGRLGIRLRACRAISTWVTRSC